MFSKISHFSLDVSDLGLYDKDGNPVQVVEIPAMACIAGDKTVELSLTQPSPTLGSFTKETQITMTVHEGRKLGAKAVVVGVSAERGGLVGPKKVTVSVMEKRGNRYTEKVTVKA